MSVTRKIGDPLYTTFQKIFTIIRIFLKSEAPKALYSSHSFIVSALITYIYKRLSETSLIPKNQSSVDFGVMEWGVMRAAIPLGCCVVGVVES